MLRRVFWWLGTTVSDEPNASIFRTEESLSGHITRCHFRECFPHIDLRENSRRIFELKREEMKGGVLPGDGRHDLYLVFALCY
jgi:hypothetical protein